MIAYTGGTFDLFHEGHLNLLKRCRELAPNRDSDEVVVGLNTNSFVRSFKGVYPEHDYDTREEALKGTGLVDRVIPNVGGPAFWLTHGVFLSGERGPIVIVVGSDWAYPNDYLSQLDIDWGWVRDQKNVLGIMMVPRTPGVSSTQLRSGQIQFPFGGKE
jgi:cytidyltransferase-like protein